jgi:prepilin-type N-terminal cleavage/methylation domain-containing protein
MKSRNGFTLLEVMVALAILAFSFVSLVLLQGRAVNWALQARNISIATQLARYQLAECKKEAQKKIAAVGDLNLEGDFTDFGYPNFTWECHAPKLNIKLPSDTELTKVAKKKAGEADVKNKVGDVNTTASAMSPFVSIISDTISNSLRELAVIVRWKEGEIPEEVRVVTHVTDHAAMIALSRVLSQGAETLLGKKKGKGQEGPGGQGVPGGHMGGGMPGGPMGGGMPGGPMGGGMPGGPMGGGMPGGPMGGGMPGGPIGGGMPGGPMGGGMPGGPMGGGMPRGPMGGGSR